MKKKQETQINKHNNLKKKISDEVKLQLPIMQEKYLKKIKGKHNFINRFIYVPDLINGGDSDNLRDFIKNKCDLDEYLSSGGVEYGLLYFRSTNPCALKLNIFSMISMAT